MAPHTRIVVGFDGSAGSWAAALHAAAEATGGGTVRLVHAQLRREAYAVLLPPGMVGDARTEAQRLLERARVTLGQAYPALDVQIQVATRGPAAALVRASRSADLLVVGRRGPGAGERRPAGAIAGHVIAYSACPVVVAGPEVPGAGRTVVLGLDPFALPSSLVAFAFRAARRLGTGLRICYVRRPEGDPSDDDADGRRQLGEAISGWRTVFADVPVALDVLSGFDPGARLLDAAARAALVVVGTRASPGGVSDILLRDATCPVAVVRSGQRPGVTPAVPGPWSPRAGTSGTGAVR